MATCDTDLGPNGDEVLHACVEEALDDLLPSYLSLTATLIMFEECDVRAERGKLRLTPKLCTQVLESLPFRREAEPLVALMATYAAARREAAGGVRAWPDRSGDR